MEVKLKQMTTKIILSGKYEYSLVTFVFRGCMGDLYVSKSNSNNNILVLDIGWGNCFCHLGEYIHNFSKENTFTENEKIIIEELSELLELDLVSIVY